MREQGEACGKNRVACLMQRQGLSGIPERKLRRTKTSSQRPAGISNHLQRDFHAAEPNTKWVTDITYIPTKEGFLYLATVMTCTHA